MRGDASGHEVERSTHVASVNTAVAGGGAEKVALSLHEEYLRRGIDSWLLVGSQNAEAPNALEIPHDPMRSLWARAVLAPVPALQARSARPGDAARLASRALRLAAEPARYAKRLRGLEDFDFPGSRAILDLPPSRPDILHLHNLHGAYFDIRALPALSAACPVVITMHDAWLLTGHCAHPLDCLKWGTGCGDCPYPSLYVPIRSDGSGENQRVKKDAIRRARPALATPSRWLMDLVERSGMLPDVADARVIANGVDTHVFAPGDRPTARSELGLPQDRRIITFAAHALRENPFKDFRTLADALAMLGGRLHRPEEVLLVALGDTAPATSVGDIKMRFVPFVSDESRVAMYFRAADLYVHPARAENMPLAIMEAMACGTPVVATRVGGIPEIVAEDETGALVDVGSADALAAAIASLLSDESRRSAYAEAGVRRVRERFTLRAQADAYLSWYEDLLAHRKRNP